MMKRRMKTDLLAQMRDGAELTPAQQLYLTVQLSIPGILSQLGAVVMDYIDASMVGHLGAQAAASIGLVSSSTWLMGGICNAFSVGYCVQVAHRIGAKKEKEARTIMKQGLLTMLLFGFLMALAGSLISPHLSVWLGGDASVRRDASVYFMIFSLSMPAFQMVIGAGGMLQSSGNMRIPSMLNILMCFLDVVFNYFCIFPEREIQLFGRTLQVPGAGLGVAGAALGTALSVLVVAALMLYFLLARSAVLHIRKKEKGRFSGETLKKALEISVPVGIESVVMGGAYVVSTRIVSPLGNTSIAAHSFSITAEGLCYMPGYGIASAATTMIGQTLGAGRRKLAERLSYITVGFGMLVMTGTGLLMYIFAPQMIGLLTSDPEIQRLAVRVLRIEAFAEPMFAASIVANGVFRGAGDTLVPSIMDFISMWAVRLPLCAFLAPRLGLTGVWIAMCTELWVRGILFLVRLRRRNKKAQSL